MKKHINKKGQSAVEYLLMLGVVTAVVLINFDGLIERVYTITSEYFTECALRIAE